MSMVRDETQSTLLRHDAEVSYRPSPTWSLLQPPPPVEAAADPLALAAGAEVSSGAESAHQGSHPGAPTSLHRLRLLLCR